MFKDFPIFPEAASTIASKVDEFYFFMVGISLFFFVLICALVIYFAIRYRRKRDDERPAAIEGSLPLELVWSIIPFGLSMLMFGWGALLYFEMYSPPQGGMEIFVVGKQWMWKVQHPEGNREINELHIPVGTPVKLIMTSEDVIHDFFVPAFRMKMDVLPGRYTTTWFEATKAGKYHLFCAEYCGTKHSEMGGWVYAMEPTEYEDWLQRQAGTGVSMVEAGGQLFGQMSCVTCHAAASGQRGPDLAGAYGQPVALMDGTLVVRDDAYLRESLLDPTSKIVQGYAPVMPTYRGQLTEEEILSLIEYIKSLSTQPSHERNIVNE